MPGSVGGSIGCTDFLPCLFDAAGLGQASARMRPRKCGRYSAVSSYPVLDRQWHPEAPSVSAAVRGAEERRTSLLKVRHLTADAPEMGGPLPGEWHGWSRYGIASAGQFAGDLFCVPPRPLTCRWQHKSRAPMHSLQNFPDRRSRDIEIVRPLQLTLNSEHNSLARNSAIHSRPTSEIRVAGEVSGMGEFSASRRDPVPESAEPTCAESWGDAALQADQRAVLQFLKQLYAPKALPNVVAHPAQGNWKRCLFTTQVEKTGQQEDLVSVDVHFLVNDDSALPYEHDVLLTSFESDALTIPCSVTSVLGSWTGRRLPERQPITRSG